MVVEKDRVNESCEDNDTARFYPPASITIKRRKTGGTHKVRFGGGAGS